MDFWVLLGTLAIISSIKRHVLTLYSDSAWYVGARESTGDFQHEAVRLQEAIQQYQRGQRDLHHLIHHSAAQRLPRYHEPSWHGARPNQSDCEAVVLPSWRDHP